MKLIATDLDRTLLPNGTEPDVPGAMDAFRQLVSRPDYTLVFVTGRNEALIREAIGEYDLPMPDWCIGSVGTKIFHVKEGIFHEDLEWDQKLDSEWPDNGFERIKERLDSIETMWLQEPDHQHSHKLSYYAKTDVPKEELVHAIHEGLKGSHDKVHIIYSIDYKDDLALIDIMPPSGNKGAALRNLIERLQPEHVYFSGDSGNDLDAFMSGFSGILVNNASASMKNTAKRLQAEHRIYLAKHPYVAGILDGLRHYGVPDL